jgi:hypothetical protein
MESWLTFAKTGGEKKKKKKEKRDKPVSGFRPPKLKQEKR